MALVLKDRVQETATANTTVSFTLSGAVTGYQDFTVIGNGNTVYYGASDGVNWEVGIGTYSTTGPTLTRTTILSSSNSGSASTFSGTVTVFCDYPSSKSVYQDSTGAVTGYTISGGTIDNTVIGGTTPAAGTFTTITGQTEVLKGTGSNLAVQSVWTGGTSGTIGSGAVAPTSWSFGSTGGTVTYASALSGSGNSIRFATTAGRPFIQQQINLYAGLTYSISFNVETVTSGTLFIQNSSSTTGIVSSSTFFVNGISVPTNTALTSNSKVQIITSVSSSTGVGNTYLRVGAGSNGADTCDVTLSNPQIEIGSIVGTYIPTTTTAVYGTPSLSFSGVAGLGLQSDGALYVSPAGTGALQAQKTDSTAAGGNARGANAVDWQTSRSAASMVAANAYSTISGGTNNTIAGAGAYSCIAGGSNNNTTGAYMGALGGGGYNNISAYYSVLAGGYANAVSGANSVISGGLSNTAAGYQNFIGGGSSNSGTASAAVATQATTIAVSASTTLYLSSANANIKVGQLVTGTGIPSSGTSVYTYATSTVTTGTAAVMNTSTISGTTLTVGSLASGTIIAGMVLTGTGVTAGTYIVSGAGSTWTVSTSQTVASTTITGTAYTFTISQNATTTAGITLSFYTPHGVVVGGGNNQATGSYSFIGGGGDAGTASQRNAASGDWSVVTGGVKNLASGLGSVVVGGGWFAAGAGNLYGNTASNTAAVVVGGANNTASGDKSVIIGGYGHSTTGSGALIGGGFANIASGNYSTVVNGYGVTTRAINHIYSFGSRSSYGGIGTSQFSFLSLAVQTTDATATVLTSDSITTASATNQVILPPNSAYYFKGSVIANVTGAANGAAWSFEGAITQGANAASTVFIGTPMLNRVATSSGASAWVVALTTDTTNGGLKITVTGAAATTIRWVAKIETTEVTY
jgi:hypothetical protein